MTFLDYQECDAKIKIHRCSMEKSSSMRALLQLLNEKFKLLFVEEIEFGTLDVILMKFLSLSTEHHLETKKKHAHQEFNARFVVQTFQKTNKLRH